MSPPEGLRSKIEFYSTLVGLIGLAITGVFFVQSAIDSMDAVHDDNKRLVMKIEHAAEKIGLQITAAMEEQLATAQATQAEIRAVREDIKAARDLEVKDDKGWSERDFDEHARLFDEALSLRELMEMSALRNAYATGLHVSEHARFHKQVESLATCRE